MAKRVVKAYGKRGVRRLDLSDEWRCVKDSPIYTRTCVLPSPLITSHKWTSVTPQAVATDHSSPATPPASSSTPNNRPFASTLETSSGSTDNSESPSPSSSGCSSTTVSPPPTMETPPPPYMRNTTTSPPPTSLSVPQCDPVFSLHGSVQPPNSPVLFKDSSNCNELRASPHPGTMMKPFSVGSSPSLKDDLVLCLSHLSLRDNHKGSLPCSSLRDPPPVIGTEMGKENVMPQEPPCSVEMTRPPPVSSASFLVGEEVHFSPALSPSRSSTPCASCHGSGAGTLTSLNFSSFLTFLSPLHPSTLSPRQKVLSLCRQSNIVPFSGYLPQGPCEVKKLGEGQYGEVFSLERAGLKAAIKVVPVDGHLHYNGDCQKSLEEMLQEMAISQELSDLSDSSGGGQTSRFVRVHRLAYCSGRYPSSLVAAWEEWAGNPDNECENDHPGMFEEEQCYVVFETENAGTDLEHAKVSKTSEAVSLFYQVCGALAVAEEALHFEHRDLHWGNVLVRPTTEASIAVTLNGTTHHIPSEGVRATIIDYTLSRMEIAGCVSYNNLTSIDWLFSGSGDQQFDVYRMMREETKGEWKAYNPRTNLLWLDYLAGKLLIKLKRPGVQIRSIAQSLLQHNSARDAFCSRQ